MPLPLTVSCFSKIQIGFSFLVPAHLGSPGERAVKRVCVCVAGLQGRGGCHRRLWVSHEGENSIKTDAVDTILIHSANIAKR